MYKIKILTIRKQKESWLKKALEEYEKRLSHSIRFDWHYAKDDRQLHAYVQKEKSFICLDSSGRTFSSEEFSTALFSAFDKNKSNISIVIGGPEGIPSHIIAQADEIWSLSTLTFTHQIARLIFVEQVYRAIEIAKGSQYHK